MPQVILARHDLLGGEPGLLHFEDFASQGIFDLLGDHVFGQFPIGRLDDLVGDLLAAGLALFVLDLAFEGAANGGPEGVHRNESDASTERLVDGLLAHALDIQDGEGDIQRFASHLDDGRFHRHLDLRRARVVGLGPDQQFVEARQLTVLKLQQGQNPNDLVGNAVVFRTIPRQNDVHIDEISGSHRGLDRLLDPVLFGEVRLVVVNVLLGDFPNRTIDLHPLIGRQFKRRTHFHFEFVLEVGILREIHRLHVEIRLVDRVDLGIFRDLFQTDHQHALLDLVGDFLLESLPDQRRGHLPRAETGNLRLGCVFQDRLIHHAGDRILGHNHAHMFLARPDIFNLGLQLQAWLGCRHIRERLIEHLLFRHVFCSRQSVPLRKRQPAPKTGTDR